MYKVGRFDRMRFRTKKLYYLKIIDNPPQIHNFEILTASGPLIILEILTSRLGASNYDTCGSFNILSCVPANVIDVIVLEYCIECHLFLYIFTTLKKRNKLSEAKIIVYLLLVVYV